MNDATQFFDTTASGEYQIERSLRFNSSDSAYLSRTPASAGNRKTWTWAGWVKRGALGSLQKVFGAGSDFTNAGITYVEFDSSDQIRLFHYALNSGGYIWQKYSSQVFRDPSAWYHICAVYDSDNATAADRAILYVNGARITAFAASSDPSSGYQAQVNNNTQTHYFSGYGSTNQFFNGYLADIHFIDGQALDPTSFGEFDANGVWQPKVYTGTYGTNGFHLPFSDNSTAAALGTDTSGNSNTWTVNNISVTAGSGNDSLVDTPTSYGTDTGAGGEVRGNYCTLNPLIKGSLTTVANGNLEMTISGWNSMFGTIAYPSTGKWYYEITLSGVNSGEALVGIFSTTGALFAAAGTYYSSVAGSYAWYNSGQKISGGVGSAYGATWGLGDVIGAAFDVDTGTLTFYKNGVSQGTAYTGITGQYFPAVARGNQAGQILICNFGQRPFAYPAPSGFKALCTTNLPDPVVAQPSTVMDVVTYTANASTQVISGLGFSPDLVWTKSRAGAWSHYVYDSVRGINKPLVTNATTAEGTQTDALTAYNSDGFTLGTQDGSNYISGQAGVAWTWDAGSSTVTNTDGSITSSVRANPSAGFSIVTYTGDGSSSSTVGHALGAVPELVIIKGRQTTNGWSVHHKSLTSGYVVQLNSISAELANSALAGGGTGTPTSSVITFDSGTVGVDNVNKSGNTFVAYCFAPVDGYSSFGSYVGNGSTDGPFVFTGMRPRWVLIKRTDASAQWVIYDSARDSYNVSKTPLAPNESTAESGFMSGYEIDILSNGFKIRNGPTAVTNASGSPFVYAAFAENPFKYARAR